jgi:glycosyltransferase involved in cell wall biosynthesis
MVFLSRFRWLPFFTPPTLIHAWTPRQNVSRTTKSLAQKFGVPYFVHLEDNEEAILSNHLGVTFKELEQMDDTARAAIPDAMIHPSGYRKFLAGSIGVTSITPSLEHFSPEGVPFMTFNPACESEFFELPLEPDEDVRSRLGIDRSVFVITYTGNVHSANDKDVSTLYKAVEMLHDSGRRVCLLRTGSSDSSIQYYRDMAARPWVIDLGKQESKDLIRYVAAANALVQPGEPGDFNNFRFPSKLPMYFASGRPLILSGTRYGLEVESGVDCIATVENTAESIRDALSTLMDAPQDAARIGKNGREFALKTFSWGVSAKRLFTFYKSCMSLSRERI